MARFRTDSLTRDPSAEEWSSYRRRRQQGAYGPTKKTTVAAVLVPVAFLLVFGAAVAVLLLPRMLRLSAQPSMSRGNLFAVLWTGVVILVVFTLVVGAIQSIRKRKRWASLARFADENGLAFRLCSADPAYPGCLFALGHSRASVNHVWSERGLLADCGRYTYTTGSGKDRTKFDWSFAAFRLPRAMPHLLLDARANNVAGLSNLPVSFSADQRLTLGAPFDEQYSLYAPVGYGPDAFYLFPPDLLSMLIDAPADFDIEIVDHWMFFYTQSPLDLTEEATWRILGDIEDSVGARLAQISDRYTDRRVSNHPAAFRGTPSLDWDQNAHGPGQAVVPIAEPGRRLRPGLSPGLLVLLGVMTVLALAFQYL